MHKDYHVLLVLLFAILLVGCSPTDSDSFPVNESGMTYGTIEEAGIPQNASRQEMSEYLPDLISATTTKGLSGYIRKEDYLSGEGNLTVYDIDGCTVLGTTS